MKIRNIELADISKYRGELMGMAILFVVLFHVSLPRTDMFFGLKRMGNVGVDMFFFLSGMGLWFSWSKAFDNPSPVAQQLKRFYLRRFLRIYPTWILVACAFYIPAYLNGKGYSANITDLIGDITINWDFWLHDELTFWYIPAQMMLYLFAPFYMELIRRHPAYRWLSVAMIMWCIIVQWVVPIHQAVGHIEIFWSRIPIFFLGINIGENIKRKDALEGQSLWLILLMFLMSFAACVYLEQVRHGRFPLFVERMLYIPMTISGLMLLSMLLRHAPAWANTTFRFLGTLSLEIYLVHVHFVLKYISPYHLGYWPNVILCIIITLPIAWLLSKTMATVTKPLEKLAK